MTIRMKPAGASKTRTVFPDRFCLVTGAPSSGTTALSRWLSLHPRVAGFSESRILIVMNKFLHEMKRFKRLNGMQPELIEKAREQTYDYYGNRQALSGCQYILDKEPLEPIALPDLQYDGFLQNVKTLFPKAKLLFMVRDPITAIHSMKRRKWGHTLNGNASRVFPIETYIENWCSCVRIMLSYADDPDAYICSFSRLVNEPGAESEAILDFLGLTGMSPFQPQKTQDVNLSNEDLHLITSTTNPYVTALNAKNIFTNTPERRHIT